MVRNLLLEDLKFVRVDVPLPLLFFELHELLVTHAGVFLEIFFLSIGQVREDTLLIRLRHFDRESIEASGEVIERDGLSVLEVEVAEGVSKDLESALYISVDQLKQSLEVRIRFRQQFLLFISLYVLLVL